MASTRVRPERTWRCGATPGDRTRAVRLSPSEQEKLLLSVAGMVARDRRARGVKLNQPEAVALLSCWVLEAARDGDRTVEQLMQAGREVLSRDDVMEGVPELVDEVQIEATFPDGRKLVTLHRPIQ
jgi:urease gamma subunit